MPCSSEIFMAFLLGLVGSVHDGGGMGGERVCVQVTT